MNNEQLLEWVKSPDRKGYELEEACRRLSLPLSGTKADKVNRLKAHLESLPAGNPAAWNPTGTTPGPIPAPAPAPTTAAAPDAAATPTAPTGRRRFWVFGPRVPAATPVVAAPAAAPGAPPEREIATEAPSRWDSVFWPALASFAAITLMVAVGFIAYWAVSNSDNGDNSNITTASQKQAANEFGGNAADWNPVPSSEGSGWLYTGPVKELTVPAGYRIDYPGHSCAVSNSSGTYGQAKVTTSGPATIWNVPGETQCPPNSAAGKQAVSNNASDPPANNGNSNVSGGNGNSASSQVESESSSTTVACISTTDMNALTHSDVQRVGGEACAYTLRVAAIGSTGITCPKVLICTLTVGDTHVYVGNDSSSYDNVTAGTVRFVAAYPSGDAVYNACQLTAKENSFGQQQVPPFTVTPGNFSCQNGKVVVESNTSASNAAVSNTATGCPTSPEDAANRVGGSASNWAVAPGSNNTGWKYGPNAPAANLTAPVGRIDANGQSGSSVTSVTEATLWCNA